MNDDGNNHDDKPANSHGGSDANVNSAPFTDITLAVSNSGPTTDVVDRGRPIPCGIGASSILRHKSNKRRRSIFERSLSPPPARDAHADDGRRSGLPDRSPPLKRRRTTKPPGQRHPSRLIVPLPSRQQTDGDMRGSRVLATQTTINHSSVSGEAGSTLAIAKAQTYVGLQSVTDQIDGKSPSSSAGRSSSSSNAVAEIVDYLAEPTVTGKNNQFDRSALSIIKKNEEVSVASRGEDSPEALVVSDNAAAPEQSPTPPNAPPAQAQALIRTQVQSKLTPENEVEQASSNAASESDSDLRSGTDAAVVGKKIAKHGDENDTKGNEERAEEIVDRVNIAAADQQATKELTEKGKSSICVESGSDDDDGFYLCAADFEEFDYKPVAGPSGVSKPVPPPSQPPPPEAPLHPAFEKVAVRAPGMSEKAKGKMSRNTVRFNQDPVPAPPPVNRISSKEHKELPKQGAEAAKPKTNLPVQAVQGVSECEVRTLNIMQSLLQQQGQSTPIIVDQQQLLALYHVAQMIEGTAWGGKVAVHPTPSSAPQAPRKEPEKSKAERPKPHTSAGLAGSATVPHSQQESTAAKSVADARAEMKSSHDEVWAKLEKASAELKTKPHDNSRGGLNKKPAAMAMAFAPIDNKVTRRPRFEPFELPAPALPLERNRPLPVLQMSSPSSPILPGPSARLRPIRSAYSRAGAPSPEGSNKPGSLSLSSFEDDVPQPGQTRRKPQWLKEKIKEAFQRPRLQTINPIYNVYSEDYVRTIPDSPGSPESTDEEDLGDEEMEPAENTDTEQGESDKREKESGDIEMKETVAASIDEEKKDSEETEEDSALADSAREIVAHVTREDKRLEVNDDNDEVSTDIVDGDDGQQKDDQENSATPPFSPPLCSSQLVQDPQGSSNVCDSHLDTQGSSTAPAQLEGASVSQTNASEKELPSQGESPRSPTELRPTAVDVDTTSIPPAPAPSSERIYTDEELFHPASRVPIPERWDEEWRTIALPLMVHTHPRAMERAGLLAGRFSYDHHQAGPDNANTSLRAGECIALVEELMQPRQDEAAAMADHYRSAHMALMRPHLQEQRREKERRRERATRGLHGVLNRI